MNTWTRIANLPTLQCYLPERNAVVVKNANDGMNILPAFTTRDMVRFGMELLGEE